MSAVVNLRIFERVEVISIFGKNLLDKIVQNPIAHF